MMELDKPPQHLNHSQKPLHWSQWRKNVNFAFVCLFTLTSYATMCQASVVWGPQTKDLGWKFEQLNKGYAFSIAGQGLGCPVMIPAAVKFGRRPVYLFGVVVSLTASLWQAQMTSLPELYIVSFLEGFAASLTEACVQMTIVDLFPVHSRGTCNGLYIIAVSVGNFLILVPAGAVVSRWGWRAAYWVVGVVQVVELVVSLFFFEETKHRSASESVYTDYDQQERQTLTNDLERHYDSDGGSENETITWSTKTSTFPHIPMTTVTPGWTSFWKSFYTPFLLLASPVVVFAALTYSFLLLSLSMSSVVTSLKFAEAPYNMSPWSVGLVFISPFLGMTLGSFFGGYLSDWDIVRRSRLNHGVYRPQMRLKLIYPGLLAVTAGLLVFGVSVSRGYHWLIPTFAFGAVSFGFGSVGSIVLTFLIDYKESLAAQSLVAVVVVRNSICMAESFSLSPWVDAVGVGNVFITAGCFCIVPLLMALYIDLGSEE
ncbi:MFS antiporter QDR3 [Yarrowia sp. C11]|nr:MFS antiporter QDR3 [Yarrowia sp. E02]KAG5367560.1 MFS antiporter QDR3 [Yarrowia sp. C11]